MTTPAASPEPVARRYVATLASQLLQLLSAAATAAIVPRELGPAVFGNYSFLLTTAATLRGFTEPSAQQAFFTFSSQDARSGSLSKLYAVWIVAQLVLLLGFVGACAFFHVAQWVWPAQHVDQIALVTLLDWVIFLALSLRQLGDSKGLTVVPQAVGAAVSGVTLTGILVLALAGRLTFYSLVLVNLGGAVLASGVLAYWLLVRHAELCWSGALFGTVRRSLARWWRYASPLIALEYYTPLAAFASAYFIQAWYGSVEQGYLALATRWSALVLVFTGAALMIVWREVASAIAQDNREYAATIYLRFNRLLILLALVSCVWLSFSSRTLVNAVAGGQYAPAAPVLAVMAFYPLAQTYGQLSTAALKATEQTRQYRNWSILISIPDVLLTYFLIAPRTARVPGLGMGAMGVALKMAFYSLVSVQLYEWTALRGFGRSYFAELRDKIVMAAVVGASAVATLIVAAGACERLMHQSVFVALVISSVMYFALIGVIGLKWPDALGLRQDDLMRLRSLLGAWPWTADAQ